MKYQKKLKNNKVQCTICPRQCILGEGQRGFCHVRKNENGNLILETYGYNTGLSIDPIEKKPLYNFYPTSNALSFGTFGCNMGCLFCQNYQMSKYRGDITVSNKSTPEQIVKVAQAHNCECVAFTYNEPIIFLEYAVDTAKLCKEAGIKTVLVTSGYINEEPRKDLFRYMDGANIDLKGFSEDFYKKHCLAHLQPVLDTIKYAVNETDCHVEINTLLIEGENDSEEMITKECEWILKNLGDYIPVHFSAFMPRYKYADRKATKFEVLKRALEIAKSMGIKYVYTGNLSTTETSTTFCKNCAEPIIIRNGYRMIEYALEDGKCKYCSCECDGRFN